MSKKIKLGIVNSSPADVAYGGVAPFIKNLDPFLQETYDVTYFTLPRKIHDLKFPRRFSFFLYLIYKIKEINQQDIILSHVPEGSYVISFTKTPLVHIFHGNFNAMTQSRFWYGKYFVAVFNKFEKRILKKAKLNYTVGKERPDVPKILNPILHSVVPKPIDEREGFIFAGRLEKIKNIDKLILIYKNLPTEIQEKNKFYIAGTGSQSESLKEHVKANQLSGKVIFLGELSNETLIETVSKKRIMTMASSQEGLPMAIAESLSVGVPVISTDTGDISRAITNEYNGFLLPLSYERKTYIESIKNILDNYSTFSDHALKSSAIFSAKTIAEKLSKDLNKLI